MQELSILILTFNSAQYISECLQSIVLLYKKELRSGLLEIVIADNNSSDNTEELARTFIEKNRESKIFFIQNGSNLGFAAGINEGMKHARGRYVIFLNPDAQVANRDLFKMVDFMKKNPKAKITGAKMVDYLNNNELSAGKFLTPIKLIPWMFGLERVFNLRFSPKKEQKVDFVSGGSMMVESDYFKKIGGFDTNFFMYVEDMELCFRVRKDGKQVFFYPAFRVRHKGQGSSSSAFAYINIFKGIYLFHKKHSSRLVLFYVQLVLSMKSLLGIMTGIVTFNQSKVTLYKKTMRFIS